MQSPTKKPDNKKYNHRQAGILDAASVLFLQAGISNTRMSDVAKQLGMANTSLTYYFKRKEDLAAACFMHSIGEYRELANQCSKLPSATERTQQFFTSYLSLLEDIKHKKRRPIMPFSELRALPEKHAQEAFPAYSAMFKDIRRIISEPQSEQTKSIKNNVYAHILLSQVLWVGTWIDRYQTADYQRVSHHMFDIFANGIAPADYEWQTPALYTFEVSDDAREPFLKAATSLINDIGYRGASVDKIAEQLDVTKGSFYHHYKSKDEVGLACFKRSFGVIQGAINQSKNAKTYGEQLIETLAYLVQYQLDESGPILGGGALATLAPNIRAEVTDSYQQVANRLTDIIIDGILEGSIRPIDPIIGAQMLIQCINAANELRLWVSELSAAEALELYLKPMFTGYLR